ncbi:hypothetical protein ABW20_dc0102884 [Dactylellina cionopaga]|nr:hypothetical protein ABW20_dc0102884 [Dactylellina cionopaga]
MASEVLHSQSGHNFYKTDSVYYSTPYSIGTNPQQKISTADYFAFKPIYAPDSKFKVLSYTWEKDHGPFTTENTFADDCKTKGIVRDVNKTTVTWQPGGDSIKIEGTTTSWEHGKWTSRSTMDDFDHPWSEMKDRYEASWSITVRIVKDEDTKAIKGSLGVIIDTGPDGKCNCKVTPFLEHTKMIMNGHDAAFEKNLISSIKEKIPILAQNIKNKLGGSGKFIYPGNGTLKFTNPKFGKWGDLLADVTYLPLKPGEFITVPGPADIKAQGNGKPRTVEPEGSKKVQPHLQLDWDTPTSAKSNNQTSLVFVGTNNGKEPVYFDNIKIFFSSGSKANDMFAASVFTAVPPESIITKGLAFVKKGLHLGKGAGSGDHTTETGASSSEKKTIPTDLTGGQHKEKAGDSKEVASDTDDKDWTEIEQPSEQLPLTQTTGTEPAPTEGSTEELPTEESSGEAAVTPPEQEEGEESTPSEDGSGEDKDQEKAGTTPSGDNPPSDPQGSRQPIRKPVIRTPAQPEKPTSKTSATVETSTGVTKCKLAVRKAAEKEVENKLVGEFNPWAVVVSSAVLEDLAVPAGGSLTITLNGPIGGPLNYSVAVEEEGKDASGKALDSYTERRLIKVR